MYLERIHGHDVLPLPSRVGGRLPLSCTGVGKALLAFAGPELLDEVLQTPLPCLTPHSLTDPARVRVEIEQVQVSGLAYETQEAALDVSCIAAPVFAGGGTAVATLSVAVPAARYHPAGLAPAVRTAALGLSPTRQQAPASAEPVLAQELATALGHREPASRYVPRPRLGFRPHDRDGESAASRQPLLRPGSVFSRDQARGGGGARGP